MVCKLARELGMDVEVVIEGADTRVDQAVVDSLYDLLVHMPRNSLDHGVETSGDRARTGKAPKAGIQLKGWQRANSVVNRDAGDGCGMDPFKQREKAASRGLTDGNVLLTSAEGTNWCTSTASRPRKRPRACPALALAWTWSRLR